MELIKISASRLKIMLSSEDMDSFELDCSDADRNTPRAREAFKRILKKAKELSGFDIGSEKLFIQLYPSRAGGCELFVSKLEPEDRLLGTDSPDTRSIYGTELAPDELGDGKRRYISASNTVCAFRFDSFSRLLDACRRLFCRAEAIHASSVYRDENAQYHLLLEMDGDEDGFLSEYGESEKSDALLMYISEHGRPVCRESAVETLSKF